MTAETFSTNTKAAAASRPSPLPFSTSTLVVAGVLALALGVSYAPSFRHLIIEWENPNYSHGYLVIPIALMILWVRREELAATPARPSIVGWLALIGLLGLRYALYERNEMWIEQATIPLVVAALVLAMGGWRLLWKATPAVAFLYFMLPLPPSLNAILANPLQRLATLGSTTLLQIMGLPVLAEGNVIIVGSDRLEVARACNGLSMLVSFVTLITATILTVARDRPIWERAVLFLSTVPIALVANILRITGTAWAYHIWGAKFGDKIAHDTAGWAMMPIALVLVWIEMKLLSWLIVEEETAPRRAFFIPAPAGGAPAPKKP
jgi:exosortase